MFNKNVLRSEFKTQKPNEDYAIDIDFNVIKIEIIFCLKESTSYKH